LEFGTWNLGLKHFGKLSCFGITCNDPDDSLNTYSLKIGGIFNASCVRSGCHNSDSHKAKVNLEGYSNCVSTFNNKKVLYTIYQEKGCKKMPKGGSKLSDDVIHDITCWAKNGYPQ
jgi:hypothetical protein